jgi:transposase
MKDNELKNQFINLRAKGLSFDKIAEKLKISKQTLLNWSKELNDTIDQLRYYEYESLAEKYNMLKKQRIDKFGKLLKNIDENLEKCDLSTLSPDKLIDLRIKLIDKLENEFKGISYSENGELDNLLKEHNGYTWEID